MHSITVIIPTLNRPQLTHRAVESVLRQSFKPLEVLIIDDGSNESSLNQLVGLLKGLPVDLYQKNNSGVSAARNFGAALAKGEWLTFLDSDDEWLEDKLTKQVEFLIQNPNYKIIHTEENWVRNGKPVPVHPKYKKQSGDIFEVSTQHCSIGPSTVLIHRDLFESQNGFDENFPACEDFELWLRLTKDHSIGLVDEPLIIKHAGHPDQLSSMPELDYWRVKALLKTLDQQPLNPLQTKQVKDSLHVKLNILSKGYQKYKNAEKLEWVNHLLEKIKP